MGRAEEIRRKYRRNAILYDLVSRRPTSRARTAAVAALRLRQGDTVVDLGCGTGLSFPLLQAAIGPRGHLVGVDVSPDMLRRARRRISEEGWTNVTLVESSAEEAGLDAESADAVLAFYTHDIATSRPALERTLAALRPGGRFVMAGVKRASGTRAFVLNAVTMGYSRAAVTTLERMERPWAILEELLGPLEVSEHAWGTGYIARGVKP